MFESQSPTLRQPAPALRVFRRYVGDFVNRQDFSVLGAIMAPSYTLDTTGIEVSGRDGAYSSAVRRQFEQFPGLQFTVQEIFVSGSSIGIRFTEHGASIRHGGANAAWPSIAIYDVHEGVLARCTIEQDYRLRNRQLAGDLPIVLDPPAVAPWDETQGERCEASEAALHAWLDSGRWLRGDPVQIDDSRIARGVEPVIEGGSVALDRVLSGRDRAGLAKVAFHGRHTGALAPGFAGDPPEPPGSQESIHLSGLVTIADGKVVAGHIIRDRLGLQRRIARRPSSVAPRCAGTDAKS